MAVTIREYHSGDYQAVVALWMKTGLDNPIRGDDEATIERTIAMGGRMLVMCDEEAGGKVIGTSWLTFDGRRIYLHHFGIAPEYQGKGLAKKLLRESLRYVRNQNCQVKLEVHRSNIAATNLYQRAGFQYLGDYDVYIIRDVQSLDA